MRAGVQHALKSVHTERQPPTTRLSYDAKAECIAAIKIVQLAIAVPTLASLPFLSMTDKLLQRS